MVCSFHKGSQIVNEEGNAKQDFLDALDFHEQNRIQSSHLTYFGSFLLTISALFSIFKQH